MSRVLVTGVEGFVGGHLARQLISDGHVVFGLHHADLPAGTPGENEPGDVTDAAGICARIERIRPDAIIHLAGLSSVAASETLTLEAYDVNIQGTLKLLEAVRRLGLRCRILLISSADVYGRANIGRPLREDDPPQPVSPYGLSKLLTGEAGRFYHRAYHTDAVILRPFSHTGPGQTPIFIFPKVAAGIVRIERGQAKPLIEMGNLEVRRDYSDVRDVCRAYSLALKNCAGGETYNITSGRPVLLAAAVETLRRLARVPVEIHSSEQHFRAHDIPVLTGDPSKFARATGWQPEIPFERTLADLLDYYRSLP